MTKSFEIPPVFINVHYDGQRIPDVENQTDLTLGANCQLYAYELLRYFGKHPPSLRSSELWNDRHYTKETRTYKTLDLMFYNKTPQAYGAHVGVYVGDAMVLHLSYVIGYPVIQKHTELLNQVKYACFIGAKRVFT
jgi:hypothetical protein